MMPSYHIGTLDSTGRAALAGETISGGEETTKSTSPTFLDPRTWKKAILTSKKTISWDTRIFTFQLDHDLQTLGLPIGQHLMMRLRDPVTREAIIRSYTPISSPSQCGSMEILVKIYFPRPASGPASASASAAVGEGERGGKMSLALDSLPLGHFIDFKGPIGKFTYLGPGLVSLNNAQPPATPLIKTFYMICAGSGITPIFQVLRSILLNPSDSTQCLVLDGNRLEEDILCKPQLDAFAQNYPEKLQLIYTLTQAGENWEGRRGRISRELLAEFVGKRQKEGRREGEAMVLICGPEALEKSCHTALRELGWRDEELMFF